MSARGAGFRAERDALRMCVAKLSAQADGLVASGAPDMKRDHLGLWLDEEFALPGDRKLRVTLRVELREPPPPAPKPKPAKPLMIEGPSA